MYPGFILIFSLTTKETTLASRESHEDRPTRFKITAAEFCTSGGSQSSPRLVDNKIVCNCSAVCKMHSKSCKLHTAESAQLYWVYSFMSFQKAEGGSLPHCLQLHKLSPSRPLPWVHTVTLPWCLRCFCFPDAGVRSFWLPSMTLVLRWSKKKSHTHGEVRQIPHYFSSSGNSISFHCNLSCFLSLSFFLVDQQSHHWRNGCASSCVAQSDRECSKDLSDWLAIWCPDCMQTPKLFDPNLKKDMRNGIKWIIVVLCLKNELK